MFLSRACVTLSRQSAKITKSHARKWTSHSAMAAARCSSFCFWRESSTTDEVQRGLGARRHAQTFPNNSSLQGLLYLPCREPADPPGATCVQYKNVLWNPASLSTIKTLFQKCVAPTLNAALDFQLEGKREGASAFQCDGPVRPAE